MDTIWLEGRASYLVFYEDTDLSGYVYHANYLKYFERAREELIGLKYVRDLYARDLHFVVARMVVTYARPGKHGDNIEVTTRMRLSGTAVSEVEQTAWRANEGEERDKLTTAMIKLAAVDRSGKIAVIPPDVLAYFAALAPASTP